MNDDKYPRVWQTNLIANLTGIFFRSGTPSPARYEESRNGNLKVVPADAIVIERSEVPPVRETAAGIAADPRFQGVMYGPPHYARSDFDPDAMWANGLANLALAEYRREHPPVDEAQVKALAAAIEGAADDDGCSLQESHPSALAHYLYLRGVRVTEDGAR